MPSLPSPGSVFSTRDKAADITFAVELKFLIRQDLNQVRSRYGNNVRPFVPHRPEELRKSMSEPESRLQRDNWEAVARAIDALPGVSATTSHEAKAQSLEHTHYWDTHWIVYKANSAVPPYLTYSHGDPEHPLLDKTAADYDKNVWTPVEICSPILSWTRKDDALSTLKRVIGVVNDQFDTVSNPSTETHVHIGRADGKFFSLRTMKKLATLLWLCEPLLRAVKDPRSPNFTHHYTWSYAWREHSRIALALGASRKGHTHGLASPPPPTTTTTTTTTITTTSTTALEGARGPRSLHDLVSGPPCDFDEFETMLQDARPAGVSFTGADGAVDGVHVVENAPPPTSHRPDAYLAEGPGGGGGGGGSHRQALRAIWRAADHRELGHLLRGPERKFRRLGFNFHALEQDASEPGPRTVEVRFLEGFLDTEVIAAWVRLCGELVDLATDGLEEGCGEQGGVEEDEDEDEEEEEVDVEDWEFYDAVALLLDLPGEWPLEARFSAFMNGLGSGRVPKAVYEPLRAVVRKNYPPPRPIEVQKGSRWHLL